MVRKEILLHFRIWANLTYKIKMKAPYLRRNENRPYRAQSPRRSNQHLVQIPMPDLHQA